MCVTLQIMVQIIYRNTLQTGATSINEETMNFTQILQVEIAYIYHIPMSLEEGLREEGVYLDLGNMDKVVSISRLLITTY